MNALRTQPADLEAERAVLAAVLLAYADAWADAHDVLGDDGGWFYSGEHAAIWAALAACARDGASGIDEIRVRSALRDAGQMHDSTDAALVGLALVLPDASQVAAHAERVRNLAVMRRFVVAASEAVGTACGGQFGDPAAFLDEAQQSIARACEDRAGEGKAVTLGSAAKDAFAGMVERAESGHGRTGATTGNSELDQITSGLMPACMIVLAGRPGMGKTACALGWALSAARESGRHALFFSREMPAEQLGARALSHEGLVDGERIRDARLSHGDMPRLKSATLALRDERFLVDDSTSELGEICRTTRRYWREHGGLSLVVVDYLQLLRVAGKFGSREQEVSAIARTLKRLAMELRVPVLALAQLNRGSESRTDKRPMVSELRESGAIEQDADQVILIYRDDVYNADSPDKGIAEWIVGKNRHGATGVVKTLFRKEFTRFEQIDRRHDEATYGEAY